LGISSPEIRVSHFHEIHWYTDLAALQYKEQK